MLTAPHFITSWLNTRGNTPPAINRYPTKESSDGMHEHHGDSDATIHEPLVIGHWEDNYHDEGLILIWSYFVCDFGHKDYSESIGSWGPKVQWLGIFGGGVTLWSGFLDVLSTWDWKSKQQDESSEEELKFHFTIIKLDLSFLGKVTRRFRIEEEAAI